MLAENRLFPRVEIEVGIWSGMGHIPIGCGMIRNLSLGGALFEAPVDLPEGKLLDLNFRLPGEKRLISLGAQVVRSQDRKMGRAIAVRFIRALSADQVLIGTFVDRHLTTQGGSTEENLPD